MTDPLPPRLSGPLARFERTLRSVGRRFRLRDADLDELTQEVRIRLWKAEERESGSTATASYVWKTAEAAAIDLFRRRRTRELHATAVSARKEDLPAGTVPDPAMRIEEQELVRQIMEAVAGLPEARRVPVRMHLAGYGRDEIASALGWTEPKTRNLIYRGLADLRDLLQARGIGPEGVR
jgi:RNA polymerase sigma factor (sigma-70 family)